MKYLSAFLLLWPLLFGPTASIPTFNATDGLVAYYSFDHCDARDESGNESHGQLYGAPGCWCGINNHGLLLNGRQDYVEFDGIVNQYFSTSDFSVSFYIKPEQYSVFRQSLLSKRSTCDEYNMLDIQLDQHTRQINTDFHETPTKDFRDISPDFKGSGWLHFALVREGRYAYTYINGVLIRKAARCSGVDISNKALLSFANSPCLEQGANRRFQGILDELRVYDKALSEEDVQALYNMYPIEKADVDCMS